MVVLAQTGRGFVAGHRTWFSARQRFRQCWISTAERQGVIACGGGHSSEAVPRLVLPLASPTLTVLVQVSLNDIMLRYPGTCRWDLCHSIRKKKPNAAVYCLNKWSTCFSNGWLDFNRIENIIHHYWCWPVDLNFLLHNILAIFVRHFKFMLLNATEWLFSPRMRLGKMYLFWMQFSAYWTEIGCGSL